jgi:arginyl-tRNA synthetase
VYQKLGLDPTEFDWEVVRQRVASMDSLSVAEFALALDDWTDADMPDELVVGESLVDLIVARLRWLAGMHADESTATEAPAAPVPGDLARRIGVASVKYADLRNDRNTDYVFDWDKMLALTGNTAPYLLYAYARIRSIYRKAAERIGQPDVYAPGAPLHVGEPAERALALRLSRLREALDAVASEPTPHLLCTYLYDLAAEFMRFYETCPVLGAADEAARLSRMRLCDLTARTLRLGLGLLGIEVIERM